MTTTIGCLNSYPEQPTQSHQMQHNLLTQEKTERVAHTAFGEADPLQDAEWKATQEEWARLLKVADENLAIVENEDRDWPCSVLKKDLEESKEVCEKTTTIGVNNPKQPSRTEKFGHLWTIIGGVSGVALFGLAAKAFSCWSLGSCIIGSFFGSFFGSYFDSITIYKH